MNEFSNINQERFFSHFPEDDKFLENELPKLLKHGGINLVISRNGCLADLNDNLSLIAPVATIVRTINSETNKPELILYNGRLSLNQIGREVNGKLSKIEHSAIFQEGDKLFLSNDTSIQFKSPYPQISNFDLSQLPQWEQDIYNLNVGEEVVVGRMNYPCEDRCVSRIHATIRRLDDLNDNNGSPIAIYKVSDGKRVKDGPQVLNDNGKWEDVTRLVLKPNRQFRLSRDGITRTVQEELYYENGNAVADIPVNRDHKLTGNIMHSICQGSIEANTCFMRPETDLNKNLFVLPSQAAAFGVFLKKGLILLANEQYDEAMKHLINVGQLTVCGYFVDHENRFFRANVSEVTRENVIEMIDKIAANSWFFPVSRKISPSYGNIVKNEGLPNTEEQHLLNEFKREIAVIFAEEVIHGYQHALGRNVSKKGELLSGMDAHEYDVALVLLEQGVKISDMYLERYGRAKEINLLKGIQRDFQQKDIQDLTIKLKPNELLILGSNPTTSNTNHHIYKITTPKDASNDEVNAYKKIARTQLAIKALSNGNYEASNLLWYTENPELRCYTTDSYGIWRPLIRPKELNSGARVRIGQYFEIKIGAN